MAEQINGEIPQLTSPDNEEAVVHLKQAITRGTHWYLALLEAIGLWTKSEEVYDGRTYRYLIDGEAFDWLLLAERLLQTVNSLVPENEVTTLLFHATPPLELSTEDFRKLVGDIKFAQYLNYFYGVASEEALIAATLEEVRKEEWSSAYNHSEFDTVDEAYRRIYGDTRDALFKRFRREKDHPPRRSTTLTELKEFTYWLFKYRLAHCDKAKVASDTKKALEQLHKRARLPRGAAPSR